MSYDNINGTLVVAEPKSQSREPLLAHAANAFEKMRSNRAVAAQARTVQLKALEDEQADIERQLVL